MVVATEGMTLVLSFGRASQMRPQYDCENDGARACFWSEPLRVAAGQEKCQKREQDIPKPNGFGLRLRRAPARIRGTRSAGDGGPVDWLQGRGRGRDPRDDGGSRCRQ